MKGTKTKTGQTTKTTTKTTTTTATGARNPGTASKYSKKTGKEANSWTYRQELKRGVPEEVANLYEELRLQRRDQGCEREGK